MSAIGPEAAVAVPLARHADNASPLRRIASDFLANPIAVAGLALLALIIAAAIAAPLISPQNPYDLAQIDIVDSKLPHRSGDPSELEVQAPLGPFAGDGN